MSLGLKDLNLSICFVNHYLCVIGQIISFSVSQFPHLQNENNKTCTFFPYGGRLILSFILCKYLVCM